MAIVPETPHVRIAVTVEIPADSAEVFAYLSDLENNPEWNWAIKTTASLNRPRARGSRYLQTRSGPRSEGEILEIIHLEQDRSLEIAAHQDDADIHYRYDLIAVAHTATRVDLSVEVRPAEVIGRPEFYSARLSEALSNNLEQLRLAVIERAASKGWSE